MEINNNQDFLNHISTMINELGIYDVGEVHAIMRYVDMRWNPFGESNYAPLSMKQYKLLEIRVSKIIKTAALNKKFKKWGILRPVIIWLWRLRYDREEE